MTMLERHSMYTEDHCWQYDIRLKNLDQDLVEAGLTKEECDRMCIADFTYKFITDKTEQRKLKEFIFRHEWLGSITQYTTHWFACYYGDLLAGVILFSMPNSFSKLVGEETKNIERLISRGACISWSPKNLASSFLMYCIKWMVKNTPYRVFSAYSDPQAKELGTIYQACNFFYLGDNFGSSKKYINPYTGKPVSDRYFRQKTAYKNYARDLGIPWQSNWNHPTGMCWKNIPTEIELSLRAYGRKMQASAEEMTVLPKHKYVYILGATKSETKLLHKVFRAKNKIFSYPKIR